MTITDTLVFVIGFVAIFFATVGVSIGFYLSPGQAEKRALRNIAAKFARPGNVHEFIAVGDNLPYVKPTDEIDVLFSNLHLSDKGCQGCRYIGRALYPNPGMEDPL